MRLLKQSSTAQALEFLLVSSSDHVTAVTGLSPTVTIRKANASAAGSFITPTGTVRELANGWYQVDGNATDTGTLGSLILHATGTGADPVDLQFEVVAVDPQSATAFITGVNSLAPPTGWNLPTFTGTPTIGGTGTLTITGAVATQAGTLPITTTTMAANLTQILGTALTETAGLIAAAFKKFFNVATPTGTVNSLPDAVGGASGGLHINGSNGGTTTYAALTVTGAFTTSGGIAVTNSTTNGAAMSLTGNGTGSGLAITSGGSANAIGININAIGAAINADGNPGLSILSATRAGVEITGGASQPGVLIVAGSGNSDAMSLEGTGTGRGLYIESGASANAEAVYIAGVGAAVDIQGAKGIYISADGGPGIEVIGDDYGLSLTGGTSALNTAPVTQIQSGLALAATALSTAVWTPTIAGRIDAAVSSRMATYTQPTGFLATTFGATVGTSAYAGTDTPGTTTLLTRITGVVMLGSAYTAPLTAQQTRDAMKLAPSAGASAEDSLDDKLDDIAETDATPVNWTAQGDSTSVTDR